jgi:hypothetical protein
MHSRSVLCIFALTCVFCRSIRADDAPPAPALDEGIPTEWKQEDADPTSHGDQIATMIQTEIDKLKSDDKSAIGGARRWLIAERELNPESGQHTSSAYLDIYTNELNKAFVAALSAPNVSVPERVNIAIITKEVTDDVQTNNLAPTAMLLLKDKSDGVVLWGQRAALNLLRMSFNNPNAKPGDCDPLRAGIIDAVRTHTTPPLAEVLAYEAYVGVNPAYFPHGDLSDTAMQCLIETNLGLQKTRLALYKSGVPDGPEVDTNASEFLLNVNPKLNYWARLTPQQQLDAVQCASDLLALSGERAAALSSSGNHELITAVQHEASYLHQLAGANFQTPDLDASLSEVESLSGSSRPEAIRKACEAVFPALQAVGAFAALKPPPDIDHVGGSEIGKESGAIAGQGG